MIFILVSLINKVFCNKSLYVRLGQWFYSVNIDSYKIYNFY